MATHYKRVLLKLSGEGLAGERGYGIDTDVLSSVAEDIKEIHSAGVQVGIVVGGGNIFRGVAGSSMGVTDRTAGDTIGMLATLMNSLMIQQALKALDIDARVLSAFKVEKACEFFIRDKAINHLNNNRVVIVAGGTGNPFFTTDSAAALRAAELECDVLFKATQVDGVYDKDPKKYPDAVKFETITPALAIEKGLKVMDTSAFALCMDNNIPILVFELLQKGNLLKAINGENVGTVVS